MKYWFELPLETRNNILIQNGIYDEATPDDIGMNSANDGEEEDIGIFDFGPKFLQKLSPWFGCPDQHFKSPDEMKNFELLLCLYCFYMTCLCDQDSERHGVMNEIRADQSIRLFGPGFEMPKASSDNLQNYKDFFCHLRLPMKITVQLKDSTDCSRMFSDTWEGRQDDGKVQLPSSLKECI